MEQNTTPKNISLCNCESSQIHAHGYDPATKTLALQFKRTVDGKRVGGNVYHYANVPAELYAEFEKAESKGTFFGANIKPKFEDFPYTKIGIPQAEEQQA